MGGGGYDHWDKDNNLKPVREEDRSLRGDIKDYLKSYGVEKLNKIISEVANEIANEKMTEVERLRKAIADHEAKIAALQQTIADMQPKGKPGRCSCRNGCKNVYCDKL